ncbi:DUF1612 domain-containing protein, partial [Mesorhizobium tamadayense]
MRRRLSRHSGCVHQRRRRRHRARHLARRRQAPCRAPGGATGRGGSFKTPVCAAVLVSPPISAVLAAAIAWEAWQDIEPLQHQHWLGPLLVAALLRQHGKVVSHLFCLNAG